MVRRLRMCRRSTLRRSSRVMDRKLLSFLVGIVIGYKGVKVSTHFLYLAVIGALVLYHFYHI